MKVHLFIDACFAHNENFFVIVFYLNQYLQFCVAIKMKKITTENRYSLKKRADSFRFAFGGLGHLFKSQPNALIHLLITILVICSGIFFRITKIEWIVLIIFIGMVIAAELINTAMEYLIDIISPEYKETAGKAKDLAAAAVLICAFAAAISGLIIFIPYIKKIL